MKSLASKSKFYFLFDTNVFNKLCRDKPFYSNYLKSLEENQLAPKEVQKGFYITPFSVLESIGIRPKYKELTSNKNNTSIISFLSQEIRTYFENLDELSVDNLRKKAQNNRPNGGTDNQNYIYNLCVERCVQENDFHQTLILNLVYDFLCKYPYKKTVFKDIFDILKLHLFLKESYEVSKFRLLSNLFDKESNRINRESIGTDKAKLNTSKGLKSQIAKDYLDTDIIHSVCMGHLSKEGLHPVIGFTFDNYNEILPRISAYKGFIYNVKKGFLNSNINGEEYLFNNRSGIICFLNKDGVIEKKVNVIDIPITGYGKDDEFITEDYKKFEQNGFENYQPSTSVSQSG